MADVRGEKNPAFIHGHTTGKFSPTYQSWATMIQRCNNPRTMYFKYYGGKGVTVHPLWLTFTNFLADMGERPLGKSLDRIDPDKGYSPDNCRWATLSEQSRHRTLVREKHLREICEFCSTQKTTDDIAAHIGLHIETVRNMIRELKTQNRVTTNRCVKRGRAKALLIVAV